MQKITDDQDEIFNVVNADDKVIRQATRGEVHKNKNLIHRSIGVAVFNSKGGIFLQQRSATKDTDPLKWTISCSGHVGSVSSTPGEPLYAGHPVKGRCPNGALRPRGVLRLYKEAAQRELWEELGVRNLKLIPVSKFICYAPHETEIQTLFKTFYDGPFKLNKEEIMQGKFFTRKELVKSVQSGKLELSFMGRVALEKLSLIH